MLTYGTTWEKHDVNVINFLNKCIDTELHLSSDKCKINCKSVPFFGKTPMTEGSEPDPVKVKLIWDWPTPINLTELLSFLGSVSYIPCFNLALTQLGHLLQTFTMKNIEFIWTGTDIQAFNHVKEAVKNDCFLQFMTS